MKFSVLRNSALRKTLTNWLEPFKIVLDQLERKQNKRLSERRERETLRLVLTFIRLPRIFGMVSLLDEIDSF